MLCIHSHPRFNVLQFIVLFLFYLFIFSLDKWSPALQIRTVLLSIQALLSAPNPDDPLANDVAETWKSNEAEAIKIGESWSSAKGLLHFISSFCLL